MAHAFSSPFTRPSFAVALQRSLSSGRSHRPEPHSIGDWYVRLPRSEYADVRRFLVSCLVLPPTPTPPRCRAADIYIYIYAAQCKITQTKRRSTSCRPKASSERRQMQIQTVRFEGEREERALKLHSKDSHVSEFLSTAYDGAWPAPSLVGLSYSSVVGVWWETASGIRQKSLSVLHFPSSVIKSQSKWNRKPHLG